MSRSSQNSISDTFQSFKQLIDTDREKACSNLDVLERINRNATNKYINIADAANGLDNDRLFLNNLNQEIDKYCQTVQILDEKSKEIEEIAKEVDEWSKEVLIKLRRLNG